MTGVASSAATIRMEDIRKGFGAVQANRGASLDVAEGEIHALVGENGAGKSTLLRILSGMYAPDAGRVEVKGRDVTGWSTAEAIEAGVGMVHQHFMLVPTLTVAENVVLGCEPTRAGQIDRARAEREVGDLSRRTGLAVRPEQRIVDLSVGEAQRVEILKTLYRGATILVLDEPTAVLSPPEVAELWQVLRRMRDGGDTIVLITHKLDEVMDISDTITVMRHGRTVERLNTADTSPAEIARAMVGRHVALAQNVATNPGATPRDHGIGGDDAEPVLRVVDLVAGDVRRASAVKRLSFTIAAGEILGVAGVEGNGQTELVEALAGVRPATSGEILLGGDPRNLARLGVRERSDAGMSHIPEDRQLRGVILDYSIADNLILGQQHRFSRNATLDRARILEHARRQIARFDIRPTDPARLARTLSGGNQQKIVIAREMNRDFRVLLAAQPTRGVDVGALEFIHSQLLDARAAGKAILLVSADLTEILALSDRVAVMYGGRFVAVLPRAASTVELLGRYMTGASEDAA